MGKWTKEEDKILRQTIEDFGTNWKAVSIEGFKGSRSNAQCFCRWNRVLRPDLIKGPWTQNEDEILISAIGLQSIGNVTWSKIAIALPGRSRDQCRWRWVNYLNPDLKRGHWTEEEDEILMLKQSELGNSWRGIVQFLPGRSENSAKNRWNSLKQKQKKINAEFICRIVT